MTRFNEFDANWEARDVNGVQTSVLRNDMAGTLIAFIHVSSSGWIFFLTLTCSTVAAP